MTQQETPAQGWSRHAQSYARLGASFTGYIAQALFHSVSARLPACAKILEVACGNGELSRAALMHCLAERLETGQCGRVIATDFSEGMVEQSVLSAFEELSGGPACALKLPASAHLLIARRG